MNTNEYPSTGGGKGDVSANLKAAALDIFKKSQRLPPLSAAIKKRGAAKSLPLPPHTVDLGDFYHL